MKKKSILRNPGVQSLITSLLCVILGVIFGYIILLLINPAGATKSMLAILRNWATSNVEAVRIRNLGNTLVKTAPLLLCSLSVLFAYKVGLFNIGASGQYAAGATAALYCALALKWSWLPCLLMAILFGSIIGAICGTLKAYCNVSEVISGIMLNWITLYSANMILANVKEPTSPYTYKLSGYGSQAKLPTLGLDKLFNGHDYVTMAIPLAVICAFVIWIILDKTKFGYELKATGLNKNAAKYAGMAENRNIILTLIISGGLAGLAAASLYLSGITQWSVTASSVPDMGFNGIAAAFLGGLNPIGAIISSYFIQNITSGGGGIDLSVYPSQIADLISAVIIYLCGFTLFFRIKLNERLDRAEEKKALKEAAATEGGKE